MTAAAFRDRPQIRMVLSVLNVPVRLPIAIEKTRQSNVSLVGHEGALMIMRTYRSGSRLLVSMALCMWSANVFAQEGDQDPEQMATEGHHRPGSNLGAGDANTVREMVLAPSTGLAYSGVGTTGSDSLIETIAVPIGFAYGVVEGFEVGTEFQAVLNRPAPQSFLGLESPRLYGRYAVIPKMLALQGEALVRTSPGDDQFGFRVEAPISYAFSRDLLFNGVATYSGFFATDSTSYDDYTQLGASVLYRFVEGFWGACQLGLTLNKLDFSTATVPVGLAAGYEFLPGMVVLPGVRFTDIGTPSTVEFQTIVAYTWDFAGSEAARPAPVAVQIPQWINRGSGAFGADQKELYGVGSSADVQNLKSAEAAADDRARAEISKILVKTFSTGTVNAAQIVERWVHPTTGEVYSLARLDMRNPTAAIVSPR